MHAHYKKLLEKQATCFFCHLLIMQEKFKQRTPTGENYDRDILKSICERDINGRLEDRVTRDMSDLL